MPADSAGCSAAVHTHALARTSPTYRLPWRRPRVAAPSGRARDGHSRRAPSSYSFWRARPGERARDATLACCAAIAMHDEGATARTPAASSSNRFGEEWGGESLLEVWAPARGVCGRRRPWRMCCQQALRAQMGHATVNTACVHTSAPRVSSRLSGVRLCALRVAVRRPASGVSPTPPGAWVAGRTEHDDGREETTNTCN